MKLSLACFAAAVVADDERFFTNLPEQQAGGFLTKDPPKWWDDKSTADRYLALVENTELVFNTYLPNRASRKLKPLFVDLIEDMKRIADKCVPGSTRKRRSDSDETHLVDQIYEGEDPMAGGERSYLSGNVDKDTDKYTKDVARWTKWVIYDQGGLCKFLGHRMVSLIDFLYLFNTKINLTHSACSH